MNVARHIKRARKARGLNQAELARRLDVSRSTILTWEKGGPGPKLDDLPRIARELGVTVADLLGIETATESKAS